MPYDTGPDNDFLAIDTKSTSNKRAKIVKWDYTKIKKLLHNRGSNQQSGKGKP